MQAEDDEEEDGKMQMERRLSEWKVSQSQGAISWIE